MKYSHKHFPDDQVALKYQVSKSRPLRGCIGFEELFHSLDDSVCPFKMILNKKATSKGRFFYVKKILSNKQMLHSQKS